MRKHNGMRPQDIAILLKIAAIQNPHWQLQPLSNELGISIAEISQSLSRSREAGLIDFHKKRPNRQSLLEFLEHGIRYVFPAAPGRLTRGIPTAHSHPWMKKVFQSDNNYVWPDPEGTMMGQSIEPFYEKQAKAAKADPQFHKLLALVDVTRVGRVREVKAAVAELKNDITGEPSQEHTKSLIRWQS